MSGSLEPEPLEAVLLLAGDLGKRKLLITCGPADTWDKQMPLGIRHAAKEMPIQRLGTNLLHIVGK
jgi:hypothetical protein